MARRSLQGVQAAVRRSEVLNDIASMHGNLPDSYREISERSLSLNSYRAIFGRAFDQIDWTVFLIYYWETETKCTVLLGQKKLSAKIM